MGADSTESVVGLRLRTHDIGDLTITSSIVFHTSGAMNPSITIAALALEAVDHLDEDL